MRLHEAAELRWRRRCPCCDRHMTPTVSVLGKSQPGTMRTRGHDRAVAHGGDNLEWLFICRKCNEKQGWLSFAAYARMLILADDPRADKVVEVARFIDAWRQQRGLAA